MGTIVVTRNFQITLPKDVREELNIRIGDKMISKKEDDKIIIRKISESPVDRAFGIWKNKVSRPSVKVVRDMREKWKRQ